MKITPFEPVTMAARGNIVPMRSFDKDIRATPIRQIEAYWHALCNRLGGVPKRAQVDPRGLENVLDQAFIAERIAPGFARFRVAGAHFTDLSGMEMRGMPVSSLFTVPARDRLSTALEHVFAGPGIAELRISAAGGIGRAGLEGQMIFLPLLSDLGDVSRVLGGIVTRGAPGRGPRRFDIDQCDLRGLAQRPVPTPQREPAGFAEPQSGFDGPVPYLRLVRSRD